MPLEEAIYRLTGKTALMHDITDRGFIAADLTAPQLRLDLPIGDDPEMRGLLHDLLLAVRPRAEALGLPLASLGDPATLAARLEEELGTHTSFASFVALVGAFARKRG